MTIQMKVTKLLSSTFLWLCELCMEVLTFVSVNKIPNHSYESYKEEYSCREVCA